jgi:hypothetical protein
VTLEVLPASPVITWPSPSSIVYGTALSGAQLNATTNAPGSFAYSPAAGSILSAGTHSLTVTFTSSSGNYTGASSTVDIVVGKVTPVITWANPAGITYGTALSATQLNASANVAGTFAYSPAAGAVISVGTQPFVGHIHAGGSANYNAAAANASIRRRQGDSADHVVEPRRHHLRHGVVRHAAERHCKRRGNVCLLASRGERWSTPARSRCR